MGVRAWLVAGAFALALLPGANGVAAQEAGSAATDDNVIVLPSPVLTLDWERLYEGSRWGRRVRADIEAASAALSAENTRIADLLVKEERALTNKRPTMDPEAFRAEADAFDQRVVGIREAQEEKSRALARQLEDERTAFVEAALPLLDSVLQARGAAVILDRRVIIRGLAQVDVTEELGARVDAVLGEGPAMASPSPDGDVAPSDAGDVPADATEGAPPVPSATGETAPPAASGN